MSKTEQHIDKMLYELNSYLKQEMLAPKTIATYITTFRAIQRFAKENGISIYTKDFGDLFLKEKYGVTKHSRGQFAVRIGNAIRVIHMLNDLLDGIMIRTFYSRKQADKLSVDFENKINEYERDYFERNLSVLTWDKIRRVLIKFLLFVMSKGVLFVNDLMSEHVESYFLSLKTCSKMNLSTERQRIKRFLVFLEQKQYVSLKLSQMLPPVILYRKSIVPSVWKESEIKQLLLSIDRNSAIGKRDYAILILALQMGLRSADIENLKLSNLIWDSKIDECKINFIQSKTGKQFIQPMPKDVAFALIDYIRNGRQNTTNRHVFLRHNCHIGRLQKIGTRIHVIAKRANLDFGERKHGMHSLRHTFASRLVQAGSPLKIVSELMGHTSVVSTGTYISVDYSSLRRCALNPKDLNK